MIKKSKQRLMFLCLAMAAAGTALVFNFTADTDAPVYTPLAGFVAGSLVGLVGAWYPEKWMTPIRTALAGVGAALLMQPVAWALVASLRPEPPGQIRYGIALLSFICFGYGGWIALPFGACVWWAAFHLESRDNDLDIV